MATQVLLGGRIIDPAHQIDRVGDLVIVDGRVAGIDVAYDASATRIDCRGNLVLPGLIDTHAHVYRYVTGRFGLDADTCGVHSGVTTLVDQGGPSCITIPGFRHYVAAPAKSRVKAFISAYLVGGLEGHYYPELYRPGCLDVDATVDSALANRDLVRGIKAHAEIGGFERWGLDVMRLAAEVGRQADLPVYIHFGQLWPSPTENRLPVDPDTIFTQVLDLVKPGDVLAHPFSRHPGGFVSTSGEVHPLVTEAVARGVRIDVGHGSHFSFAMARQVLGAGFVPDTLGADMHGYNTRVPPPPGTPAIHPDEGDHMFAGAVRFSLVSAMTSMLALGLSLEQVVPMVTTHAARLLQMEDEIGHLGLGAVADVSVLHDERGKWTLRDNEGNQAVTSQYLRPRFCLRAGERFDADAGILPQPQSLAA
ncbi:amidohydrolase/deacetylase family metallohydrolase [Achromobacter sp. GG226]|uniref:amidohydrolase/deacetylase family metallohydrolase n=1 Tax=Verticiella alkaliphila TaxID=2779529 RepID=UPI001C0B4949|nr:amidohydrolase/deacetylase family metallohydrolase [Verticiella sp. GG226]MBU4611716.1 amidohydrolase/deacetylase family metallohydrolase [Verticiella sp. GG226]